MPNNEWGDFQTPAELAEMAVASLPSGKWRRVLEPTCGHGQFLDATRSLGARVERRGIEIQASYADQARNRGFEVLQRNIFELDLGRDVEWSLDGPLLVIGNPPWVTSSQLGALGSINLPAKSNIRNLRGFDAMTGSSNFDIAEFILLKLMLELIADRPTISLLVKTQVARNVLSFAEQFQLPYSSFSIREIDAKKWFGASVDACLFTMAYSARPSYECAVFSSVDAVQETHRIGVVAGRLVADIGRYERTAFADGACQLEWRSGVKHDASAVMELSLARIHELGLESSYVFPLLKCSDLFRGRLEPSRGMVVPQLSFGEDTAHLSEDAPILWSYLHENAKVLDGRGSSIYRSQPRFAVFGLGQYTFAPFKIAISGLHKEARFVARGPVDGKPVVVDDASYTLSFDDSSEAAVVLALLRSQPAQDLLASLVFWDAKRPINKKLLQRIDLLAVARELSTDEIVHAARATAQEFGIAEGPSDASALSRLTRQWEMRARGLASDASQRQPAQLELI